MRRQTRTLLCAVSIVLGVTSTAVGQAGTYTPIDVPGASLTQAWAINSGGEIVGLYTMGGVTHGFKLSGGQLTTLDYPGATYTEADGINDRGDISGAYQDTNKVYHGYLLSGGQFTTIDFPNASATQPWGVSPSGEVVGQYTISGVNHGFKWSGNQYLTIDPPGATTTTATGINFGGDISGVCMISGTVHGFVLSNGEYTIIDVPGSTYTNATALTARGEIIGRYLASGVSYGYVLREGLFSTIGFPGATFTGSAAMNARGDIVGRYRSADGVFHGFLLTFAPHVAITPGGPAVTHSADFQLVTAGKPAVPGEVLSVFATGLGPTQPDVAPGTPFPTNPLAAVTSAIEVRVNGKPAELLGAAGLPGTVGGYQVNFRMPSDTPTGSASLQLSAGMAADTSVKVIVQ